jgi:hypothetical protein
MAQDVNGLKIYTIAEALQCADVSRATYFRWVKLGRIRDTRYKDRNGRRVFTQSEVDTLVGFAKKLVETPQLGFSPHIDLKGESS